VRVIGLAEIRAVFDEDAAYAAVEESFRQFSAGRARQTAVGHLQFDAPPGDCHVKGAYICGGDCFVIKVATSFYRNSAAGLPSSNGFMAVISAQNGQVHALLHDQGYLTDRRTALAEAIAARAIVRRGAQVLGVIGSGTQARMQAQAIAQALGTKKTLVWARSADKAGALAEEIGGETAALADLCRRADLIVTTTPATEAIITAAMLPAGARIVAVGADAPGKRELDLDRLATVRWVADARNQCADHGEASWAVRSGRVRPDELLELGEILASPFAFGDEETVVADLTGLGVQDLAIATCVWARLQGAA